MVIMAEDKVSFCTLRKEAAFCVFEEDSTMPTFPQATLARFAPNKGNQVAVMDNKGLHFVDTKTGLVSFSLAGSTYVALEYSPCDTFVIGCEKWNPKSPSKNLHIIDANTGKIIAMWDWKKTPKDAPKSLKFMQDESYCFRLVP